MANGNGREYEFVDRPKGDDAFRDWMKETNVWGSAEPAAWELLIEITGLMVKERRRSGSNNDTDCRPLAVNLIIEAYKNPQNEGAVRRIFKLREQFGNNNEVKPA